MCVCVCVCVCFQSGVLHAATNQYSISVDVNSYYSVYVVAVAHHGSSQPSDRVTAVIADSKSSCNVLAHLQSC